VLALIGFVLMPTAEGGALGIGGGGGGFMSSRGTGNLLTRATGFLAAAFFATSLILSILAGWGRQQESIIRPGPTAPSPSAPGPAAPTSGPSILDQLRPPAPAPRRAARRGRSKPDRRPDFRALRQACDAISLVESVFED
jgi:preprotein translocase subunit SecG